MKTKTWNFMVLMLVCLVLLLPAKPSAKIRVTVASANIRSGPAANAPVIGQGKQGEMFDVLGKEGSWLRVRLPQDKATDPDEGFIHQSVIEETRTEESVRQEDTAPARRGPEKTAPAPRMTPQREKLLAGFFVEGGLMISPKTESFADKWLLGIGFDKGINPYISLGMEFQPHIRSVSEFKLTYISANLFVNVRGGINLGRLAPALKFWTPYVGFGPGTALSFTHVSNPGGSYNKFQANFAYHFTIGSEFALGSKGLFVEYQIVRVSQPNVDPDSSCSFLVAGLRF